MVSREFITEKLSEILSKKNSNVQGNGKSLMTNVEKTSKFLSSYPKLSSKLIALSQDGTGSSFDSLLNSNGTLNTSKIE